MDCGCLDDNGKPIKDSAAHHIVPKGGGSPSVNLVQLQVCSEVKNKVTVDSAHNGVCLPRYEGRNDKLPVDSQNNTIRTRTDGAKHAGREGDLHGEVVVRALLNLCNSNNEAQWKSNLDKIAENLSRGQEMFNGISIP